MNKAAWLKASKDAGFSEFEIYEQRNTSTSIDIYDQKVDSFSISDCDGICLRGVYEGKMANFFLEEISDEMMDDVLNQMKQNASVITSDDEVMILGPDNKGRLSISVNENNLIETPNELKIEKLKALEKTLSEMDPRISQVMVTSYGEASGIRSIVNTKGIDLEDSDRNAIVCVEVLAKDGDDAKSAFDWLYLNTLEDLDVEKFARNLCDKVTSKLHADTITSGKYPVIIEKGAMTSLFASLSGLFNGENAYKGISLLKGKLNTPIFDEKITIIDDPLLKGGINSCAFDDEGSTCMTKTVVDKGVLKTYLHNSKSANLMKCETTANGFKSGYAGPVGILPTNFYIENGDTSYEDMIKSMKKGIIVTNVNGLHAGLNPISTEFSLQSEGFYVEDGKIVKPINLFTIAANFMQLMNNIEMVGNDLKMGMNGIGTPSILFKEIAVSGN